MAGTIVRQSVVFDGSDQSYTAPDDADVTLGGFSDRLVLGTGDAVLVSGSGDVITGASPAGVDVYGDDDTVGVAGGSVQIAAGEVTTLSGQGSLDFVGSGTSYATFLPGAAYTVQASGPADLTVDPGVALTVTASTLPDVAIGTGGADLSGAGAGSLPAAASVTITTPATPSAAGVDGGIQGFAGVAGAGARVFDIQLFQDGSAEAIAPGSGAFGIFEIRTFDFGSISPTTVYDVSNGESISREVAGGEQVGATAVSQTVTFSGLDLTGVPIRTVYDYAGGTSSIVLPANGAFGIFRTDTYFAGADGNGAQYGISYDIANGTSSSVYAANGAFGVASATLLTSGLDATGTVRRLSFDDVNGQSFNFSDAPGYPQRETETVTSGHDGTGTVLATMNVAAGTGVAAFRSFTGQNFPAAADPIPLDLGDVGPVIPAHIAVGPSPLAPVPSAVTLSDFAATPASAVRAATAIPSVGTSPLPIPPRAAALPVTIGGSDHQGFVPPPS